MPENDILSQMKKQWPGVAILTSNSNTDPSLNPPGFSTTALATSTSYTKTSPPLPPPHTCHYCGETAKLACGCCKGHPSGYRDKTRFNQYCPGPCRKAHWTFHSFGCKAATTRTLLYRAANIIKALFYIHQKTTFAWGYFEKVEKHGPERMVYLDQVQNETKKTMLVPFSTVTDLVVEPLEQEAYLTHLSCTSAVARYGPILAEVMIDTILSIEEILLFPKNAKIEIFQYRGQNRNKFIKVKDGWQHRILRVTLENHEQYAIDLSGAQYGHSEECLPWEEYAAARIEKIFSINPFGFTKQFEADELKRRGFPHNLGASLNNHFANELRIAIRNWEHQEGSINAMLVSPEQEYEEKKGSLLEVVGWLMKMSRDDSINQGSWCRK